MQGFNISVYFWLHWVFIATLGLFLVGAIGDYSLAAVASLVWSTGSKAHGAHGLRRCRSQALEHRLSSCSVQQRLGIEPTSLALQVGFLISGPPGKPSFNTLVSLFQAESGRLPF